jgi:transposase
MEGMHLSTSPDTLLRLIRATPDKPLTTPRILGVDDFAFRRRRTYGTILIDLEKRIPIDLLADREAATLAKWLQEHPGVEIISRDRGGDYAKGAKEGAPSAKQVADRWHLLKNLSETMQSYFLRKHVQLKAASTEATAEISAVTVPTVPWHTGMRHPPRREKSEVPSGARRALSPDP